MKTILCFGDSNTWGYRPEGGGSRLSENERWPKLLEKELGAEYHVIEEGLNGRTTAFEDAIRPHRSSLPYIIPCLESHAPLDLIILMLGTNDCKRRYHVSAEEITDGLELLLRTIYNHYRYMPPTPQLLVMAPFPMGDNNQDEEMDAFSIEKSKQLPFLYAERCQEYPCSYFDPGPLSLGEWTADFEHINTATHARLAAALALRIPALLAQNNELSEF